VYGYYTTVLPMDYLGVRVTVSRGLGGRGGGFSVSCWWVVVVVVGDELGRSQGRLQLDALQSRHEETEEGRKGYEYAVG